MYLWQQVEHIFSGCRLFGRLRERSLFLLWAQGLTLGTDKPHFDFQSLPHGNTWYNLGFGLIILFNVPTKDLYLTT